MFMRSYVHLFDIPTARYVGAELMIDGEQVHITRLGHDVESDLYLSPGFIDTHTHCYYGGAYLSVEPSAIGLRHGVHMLIDAGSSGASNYIAFRDFVAPKYRTGIRAFLNISDIGLATGQPYHDMRYVNPQRTADCLKEDAGRFLLGVKVLSSQVRVEEQGLEPLRRAVEAASMADVPIMAHLSEGPPFNEETIPLLRKGDIISHAFHGDKSAYSGKSNLMFYEDGRPVDVMEEAINRGVVLDVGHGSASMDAHIARAVVETGRRDFIISTDLHISSIVKGVYSLPVTMTKFLLFGMTIDEVTASVTTIPAKALGLTGWGSDLTQNATLFRVRKTREEDLPLEDSVGNRMEFGQRIEAAGVIVDGKYTAL